MQRLVSIIHYHLAPLYMRYREPEDEQSCVCAVPTQQYISVIMSGGSKKPLDNSKISTDTGTAVHNTRASYGYIQCGLILSAAWRFSYMFSAHSGVGS